MRAPLDPLDPPFRIADTIFRLFRLFRLSIYRIDLQGIENRWERRKIGAAAAGRKSEGKIIGRGKSERGSA
jgi:hypothetical protein